MELFEIQDGSELKIQHKSAQSPVIFWKFVPELKYPHLKNAA